MKTGIPHAGRQPSYLQCSKRALPLLVLALAACQHSALKALTPPPPAASGHWQLSVSPGDDLSYRIHIADAQGREVQIIDGQEGAPPYEAAQLLTLDDFTGDGKPDILARGLSAGASALISERIYVYDAGQGRFLDAELFRNDGEVSKTGPGCIAVEYRNRDYMTYAKDQYCWEGRWVFKGSLPSPTGATAPSDSDVLATLSARSLIPVEELQQLLSDCERTQLNMNICAFRDFVAADLELAAVLNARQASASPACQAQIRRTQADWEAEREGTCKEEAKAHEGGSMRPMLISTCKTAATRIRTRLLQEADPCLAEQ